MLCTSCIIRRASKLPGIINICLRLQFAEDYGSDQRPGGRFFQIMKTLDGEDSLLEGGAQVAPDLSTTFTPATCLHC